MQELGAMETILEEVEERYILRLSFECNEGFWLLQKEIFKDLLAIWLNLILVFKVRELSQSVCECLSPLSSSVYIINAESVSLMCCKLPLTVYFF